MAMAMVVTVNIVHSTISRPSSRFKEQACTSGTVSSVSNIVKTKKNGFGFKFSSQRCHYGGFKCQAVSPDSAESRVVYSGIYGGWTVDSADIREVILYRAGLVSAAASLVACASNAFLPLDLSSNLLTSNMDAFYAVGAGGLGLSLYMIHIYVTEIKRTLQALWTLGVIGSLATYWTLARPAGDSLVHYVIDNPTSVWFVGPLFASLTGLVFKEGLCYGKLEAGILTFVIPMLLLGHLSGLMDEGTELVLLGAWMTLFVVFAGRKFTQPIKDDIGDKSVFMFNALSEEEKKVLVEKLEQQQQL